MPTWVDEILDNPSLQPYKPQRPWQAAQAEENVLFLHYRFTPDELRPFVPQQLELMTYDGSAWVALIACHVTDMCFRSLPVPIPKALGSFGEIDLAVIARYRGRHGLYFLSIEGAKRLPSWVTRRASGLPYRYAEGLQVRREGDGCLAKSGPRWVRSRPAAEFQARFSAWNPVEVPDRGSPIDVLAGQYSAFTIHRQRVCELDEIHEPWDLHEAQVDLQQNTLLEAAGIGGNRRPELQHYSPGRRIVTWLPQPVGAGRSGLAPSHPEDG